MENIKNVEVGQLISSPLVVSPSSPVSKIIGVLKQSNGYEVFVEGKKKIGMVTQRNILRASNITHVKAETLAFYVPKLKMSDQVSRAARLMMEYRIRSVPIVRDREIHCVTALSIINAIRDWRSLNFKAADIMTSNPVCLEEKALASKARQLAVRRQIDHIPILAKNELKGILTSSHLVFNMLQATETMERTTIVSEEQKKLEFPVKHIMDTHPLTCKPDDKISLVFGEMVKLRKTYSIVRLWEEVQGIITYRDYMKLLAEQFEADSVPVYIIGLPQDPFEAEMAKIKFRRTSESLKRSYPYIEEAKSIIKTFSEKGKTRRRYEVKVSLVTPKRVFNYSETGWELPVVYDAISAKLKKMLQKKRRIRYKRQI